jgi:glycosyltransferase involved in cell wall biosynthesis
MDNGLTICHITSMHDYNDDRIFERAAKGLYSLGNNILLIAPYTGDDEIEGIKIVGLKKRNGLSRRINTSCEAYKKAKKVRAHIFHFHDPDLIPWMVLLSFSGRKVVYDVHENYESRMYKLPFPVFVNKIFAGIYRKLERLISNRFAGVTVVTESMKDLFKGLKKPICVTGNVVYLERLKSVIIDPRYKNRFLIYTSGTNSASRNCINTIEALPSILKEIPNVVMKFVGRYHPESFKKQMLERARELGVLNSITIEGMIPWEENFARTAEAAIGCVFYEDNPNNRVTLPNRLFEYMFCGVAVLGEDFPEVRNILEETSAGICVISSDPEAIAEKAIFLFKNPELMVEMGANGRKAVLEKYNFEIALIDLMGFYKEILNPVAHA